METVEATVVVGGIVLVVTRVVLVVGVVVGAVVVDATVPVLVCTVDTVVVVSLQPTPKHSAKS